MIIFFSSLVTTLHLKPHFHALGRIVLSVVVTSAKKIIGLLWFMQAAPWVTHDFSMIDNWW